MVQQYQTLDSTFGALSDPTRRGIVEQLGRGDTSITDLATRFRMTLTGVKKHVRILEDAGMVSTEKRGRVRRCRLRGRRLEEETKWLDDYNRMLEQRLDSLGEFLEHQEGASR